MASLNQGVMLELWPKLPLIEEPERYAAYTKKRNAFKGQQIS